VAVHVDYCCNAHAARLGETADTPRARRTGPVDKLPDAHREGAPDGKVTFTTVFPAAYQGRWPHIHLEVYSSLSEASAAGKISATSQLALPADVCNTVYATSGYDGSAQNMSRTSLDNDNVFGDDSGVHQLATVTGGRQGGYVARLTVGV
jgi:hypothetical protein